MTLSLRICYDVKLDFFCLNFQKALHMRSLRTFKDDFGVVRKNGEEWLITMKESETHIPGVYEEVSYCTLVFTQGS